MRCSLLLNIRAPGCQGSASLEPSSRFIELLAAIPVLFDQLFGLRNADAVLPGKVADLVFFSAGNPSPVRTTAIGFVIRHFVTPYTTITLQKCVTMGSGFLVR